MNNDLAVANTIADQIGNRAFMMMGAKDKLGSADSLQFKIQGSKFANAVRVTLEADDTYTVAFFKVRKFDFNEVASVGMVYADQLRSVIESKTGLYLSL